MYLRGGQWNLRRKSRKPSNPLTILFLLGVIGVLWYFYRVEVPTLPERFQPTRTPTTSPDEYLRQAGDLFIQGKVKPAITAYESAILVDPGNPATYVELARLQVFDGQYEAAVDSAEKALILNPDYSMAHAVKGWALDYLGNFLEAEGAVRKAIELDPNNARAYAYLAEVLIDIDSYGNLDAASEASKKAKALAPDELESFRARGYVLENSGNAEEAVQEYKAAIAINDKLWELHFRLGLVYYYLQDYDSAVQEYNQAVSFNPTNPEIPRELARTQFSAGQYSKAVQYAEQSAKIDPTNPTWHGVLGFYLFKEGKDYKRASQELGLFVQGGTTADGAIVEGKPLDTLQNEDYYYSIYGLSLTKQDPPRCAEAVPIFQLILQNVNAERDSFYNATEGLNYCLYGPPTPVPTQTPSP
jgi:tetratricopeptide (TPR) repeat protein